MSEISRFVVSLAVTVLGIVLFRTGAAETVGAIVAVIGAYFAAQAVCDHADRKGLEAQVAKRTALPQKRRH